MIPRPSHPKITLTRLGLIIRNTMEPTKPRTKTWNRQKNCSLSIYPKEKTKMLAEITPTVKINPVLKQSRITGNSKISPPNLPISQEINIAVEVADT